MNGKTTGYFFVCGPPPQVKRYAKVLRGLVFDSPCALNKAAAVLRLRHSIHVHRIYEQCRYRRIRKMTRFH